MSGAWHILRDGDTLTLCRALPPRFDVRADALLPAARPERLAHQIRQDLWRALQRVRGFSPVVRLAPTAAGWHVTAGGRIAGRAARDTEARIAAVLDDPARRTRWARNARVTT